MTPVISILLGVVLLTVLFRRANPGERKFLGRGVLIALLLVIGLVAVLVLR